LNLARCENIATGSMEVLGRGLQAALGKGNASSDVLAAQTFDEAIKVLGWRTQAALGRGFQKQVQLIKALVAAVDCIAQTSQDGFGR